MVDFSSIVKSITGLLELVSTGFVRRVRSFTWDDGISISIDAIVITYSAFLMGDIHTLRLLMRTFDEFLFQKSIITTIVQEKRGDGQFQCNRPFQRKHTTIL